VLRRNGRFWSHHQHASGELKVVSGAQAGAAAVMWLSTHSQRSATAKVGAHPYFVDENAGLRAAVVGVRANRRPSATAG
jgi:hypothetical protein